MRACASGSPPSTVPAPFHCLTSRRWPTNTTERAQPRYHSPRSRAAAQAYAKIAKSNNLSLAQLALAWCKSRWYVASTIIGATSMEQLRENIAAFHLDLDAETLAAIDAVHLDINPNVTD